MKKKVFNLCLIGILSIFVSGCTSNIVAKYDNYNETFSGKTYYDSLAYRATIDVISDRNQARCIGNAKMYTYPIWQFDLVCSDGRSVTGLLTSGKTEGTAFTNRNEKITFTIAKKQNTIARAESKYQSEVKNAPMLDNSKEHIKVIMQR